MLAADADEAVPRRALPAALEDQFDVVPVIEGSAISSALCGIGLPHRLHHRVGEHDAPAEGVVRLVALDDGDRVLGMAQLHQQPEIKAGRPSSDTDDPHARPPIAPVISSLKYWRRRGGQAGRCGAPCGAGAQITLIQDGELAPRRSLHLAKPPSASLSVASSTSAINSLHPTFVRARHHGEASRPCGVSRATVTRRSPSSVSRWIRPSASSRSARPVMLPLVTIVRRESSPSRSPSGSR